VALLKEQAALLGQKTQNLVTARVGVSRFSSNENEFAFEFVLQAPALGDYSYVLFAILYGIEIYPVEFFVAREFFKERPPGIRVDESGPDLEVTAENEEQLITVLRLILQSERTRQIVQGILAQSQALATP
jgi:hypothetical protein